MENVGTPKEPRFSTKGRRLQAAGKEIEVPGGDAGPVFEEWDGDGKRDLLSGAGDGSAWLGRTRSRPRANAKSNTRRSKAVAAGWPKASPMAFMGCSILVARFSARSRRAADSSQVHRAARPGRGRAGAIVEFRLRP